jgi:hypothetical protein
MRPAAPVIWLHPLAAPAAATPPARCDEPVLEGEPQRVERVMHALRRVPVAGANLVDAHLIRRLRVVPGEAELVLGFAPASAGERAAAEQAFQALRRTLPDTDVYVAHAA